MITIMMLVTDLTHAAIVSGQQQPPNEMVRCYNQVGSCAGTFVAATFSDCCDHSVDPVGFAYQREGVEVCFSCPVSK